MASDEVILPRYLLFILWLAVILFLWYGEAVGGMEDRQRDSCLYHCLDHAAACRQRLEPMGDTHSRKHQGVHDFGDGG